MKVYSDLEFDIILKNVSALASSDVVADAILSTTPTTDLDVANKLLTQTGDAVNVLASHRPNLMFDDIEPLLSKARVGASLTPKELLSVTDHVRALHSLKTNVESMDGCDS